MPFRFPEKGVFLRVTIFVMHLQFMLYNVSFSFFQFGSLTDPLASIPAEAWFYYESKAATFERFSTKW